MIEADAKKREREEAEDGGMTMQFSRLNFSTSKNKSHESTPLWATDSEH
jgi:hypothetical protein